MDPITLTPTMAAMLQNIATGQNPSAGLTEDLKARVDSMRELCRTRLVYSSIDGSIKTTELGCLSLIHHLEIRK